MKYYLSLTSHPFHHTKYADSNYFDTIEEVEEWLIHHFPAKDSMWVNTCHVGIVFNESMPEVVSCWQDGNSQLWGRIVKSQIWEEEGQSQKPAETRLGLSSLIIQLTGNRTAELGSSDKIDIVTPDGNHRFSIDELRLIVKFWDATQTILNEA
jgi:hypothetical protein